MESRKREGDMWRCGICYCVQKRYRKDKQDRTEMGHVRGVDGNVEERIGKGNTSLGGQSVSLQL